MRVLLVSHTVFSSTNNMGKTMASWFADFSGEEVAQFYIQPALPEGDFPCANYYRVTDGDVLHALLGRKKTTREPAPEPSRGMQRLYRYGAGRSPGCYFLRNLLWRVSPWDKENLRGWVEAFSSEVIFLAAGDYGFLYDLAADMARWTQKPLVMAWVDDYVSHPKGKGLLWKWEHRRFLRAVHRAMKQTAMLFAISEPMKAAYESRFEIPCRLLRTGTETVAASACKGRQLSYVGNLGLGRGEQLVQMGRILQRHRGSGIPEWIDVYSREENPRMCRRLNREPGIRFHGGVTAEQVQTVFADSLALIHTESFAQPFREKVRFSVSTKIPESLGKGPCLIAYGPEEAASIAYLQETGSAWVITDPAQLEERLVKILREAPLREEICRQARATAQRNHSRKENSAALRKSLEAVCKSREGAAL